MHASTIRLVIAVMAAATVAYDTSGAASAPESASVSAVSAPLQGPGVITPAACTPLQNGVAATGLSAAKGAQPCFQIDVPVGQSFLAVSMSGGTGNAALYVRLGSTPTLRAYDCRNTGKTSNETCTMSDPGQGTWYVMLNATTAFSGVSLTITAQGGPLVVNSLDDSAVPPSGQMTLRAALAAALPDQKITFDASLNGQTILLSTVGEAHSVLKGEVYDSTGAFVGYQDRDYGKSALYARKNVVIDASQLTNGITVKWSGGEANPARVLAVYGNLTMSNVTISSGYSVAEPIAGNPAQTYTLARGGGLAVWGTATLSRCRVVSNAITSSALGRDLAAYGGGIYANGLDLRDCVVSGNKAIASGAAGGGIYSVGGADNTTGSGNDTFLDRCTVSGNLVQAVNAYGGGIFTLSGGPSNLATMRVANSTVAMNVVEQTPGTTSPMYYRGGGVYMGGGSLQLVASTITENTVRGIPLLKSGKPNMGGGGVGATIGNAHTVEYVWLQNSIVVGNTLELRQGDGSHIPTAEDWFAGSLIEFNSGGYNLVGTLDFSQILVPIPPWLDLSRKHWPKVGDLQGVDLVDALDKGNARYDTSVTSVGVNPGGPVVLWYPPGPAALDKIADTQYQVTNTYGGYSGNGVPTDDFLNHVIQQVQQVYGEILPAAFASQDRTGTTWYGPARTWPSEPQNAAWIQFWRDLDGQLSSQSTIPLGMELLADDFWGTFTTGWLDGNLYLTINEGSQTYTREMYDQTGKARPSGSLVDIGAIEK